ncbi:GDP-D-glucose phosphorylase 1 [Lamellibrachia satsuma]|nr:GDP-D-glucose phosphorylase 1 [Lamellibrachia satsuma]
MHQDSTIFLPNIPGNITEERSPSTRQHPKNHSLLDIFDVEGRRQASDMAVQYKYTQKDLCNSCLTWSDLQQNGHSWLTEFDTLLRSRWTTAMANGHFKYTLDDVKTRIVPGRRGYVLQLNRKRFFERRQPEFISALTMPFDPTKFNFTKVKPGEVICEMCPVNSLGSDDCENDRARGKHLLLINVSPCELGHVLLVPDVEGGLPQVLTLKAMQLALQMQLLSTHPGFRVAFNSLCAFASVNHLHLHAWYLEHPVMIDNAPVKEVVSGCYETTDHPCRALVFQLHKSTVDQLARNVHLVTSYMQDTNIAHNLLVSRGEVIGENSGVAKTTVRVYIWPRTPFTGDKDVLCKTVFITAVFEFAGHVPMFAPEWFETFTEEEIEKKVTEASLSKEQFDVIKADVQKILSSQ